MTASWSCADVHVHTRASDGQSTPAEVLEAARAAGLRVIAITDHDTIGAALEARRIAPAYGVEVIVGEEVSTADGHLLALWIERRLAPGRPLAETVAEVRAQGGVCAVAHPFGWMVSSVGPRIYERYAADWAVDGVESFNASLPLPWNNAQAARLAASTGLAALGGSDAHHASTVGSGLTRFPGTSAADLRAAILARQTVAEGRSWGARRTAIYLGNEVRRSIAGLVRSRAGLAQR